MFIIYCGDYDHQCPFKYNLWEHGVFGLHDIYDEYLERCEYDEQYCNESLWIVPGTIE